MPQLTETIDLATAERCFPGERVSGDNWSLHSAGDRHRITVIDGAGHGASAAEAATLALLLIAEHPDWDGPEVLEHCHAALRGTRGAVMTVAVLDTRQNSLVVSGVGNVESYLWTGGKERHLVTQRGMLGSAIPKIRPTTIELSGPWTLVLHSDGVRARFSLSEPSLQRAMSEGAVELAEALLENYARKDDDALVVVIRQPN